MSSWCTARSCSVPEDERAAGDPLDVGSMTREEGNRLKRRLLAQHPKLVDKYRALASDDPQRTIESQYVAPSPCRRRRLCLLAPNGWSDEGTVRDTRRPPLDHSRVPAELEPWLLYTNLPFTLSHRMVERKELDADPSVHARTRV
jgi:hypothetical protein